MMRSFGLFVALLLCGCPDKADRNEAIPVRLESELKTEKSTTRGLGRVRSASDRPRDFAAEAEAPSLVRGSDAALVEAVRAQLESVADSGLWDDLDVDVQSKSIAGPEGAERFQVTVAVAGVALHPPSSTSLQATISGTMTVFADADAVTPALANAIAERVATTLAGAVPDGAAPATAPPPVVEVAAGNPVLCLLHEDQQVRCKRNVDDSLIAVPGMSNAAQVVAGGAWACARTQDGRVLCLEPSRWESHEGFAAQEVCGLGTVIDVAVEGERGCAIDSEGAVRCWDADSPTDACEGRPRLSVVAGVLEAKRVFAGVAGACAYGVDKRSLCWRWDESDNPRPVAIDAAKELEPMAYTFRLCGRTGEREVGCVPTSKVGNVIRTALPGKVVGLSTAMVRNALLEDGSVVAWWGDGAPKAVALPATAKRIATGIDRSYALMADGAVVRWEDKAPELVKPVSLAF